MSPPAGLRSWTPAQITALLFGVWWIGNGVAVFLALGSSAGALDTNGVVEFFGLSIAVNGWHGVFHLLTGVAGVAACRRPRSASAFALLIGTLYTAAAVCSLFTGATVFGLIHVDEFGSADHAVEGVLLLIVWLASRNKPRG